MTSFCQGLWLRKGLRQHFCLSVFDILLRVLIRGEKGSVTLVEVSILGGMFREIEGMEKGWVSV